MHIHQFTTGSNSVAVYKESRVVDSTAGPHERSITSQNKKKLNTTPN